MRMSGSAKSSDLTVGVIGLGNMGMRMFHRIRRSGFDMNFVARRTEVVTEAEAMGAIRASSPAVLAANSDVTVVAVFDDDQLLDICMDDDGIMSGLRRGATLVSHVTGSPRTISMLSDAAQSRGGSVVDAAISGTSDDIDAGQLTVLVGGDERDIERIQPVLAAYAHPIVPVGGVGDGQRVKLLNNALFAAGVSLATEAERIADQLGLDPSAAFAAISACSGGSYAVQAVSRFGSAMSLRDGAGPYLRKDLSAIDRLAVEEDLSLGLLGEVARRAVDPKSEADNPKG